MGARVVSIVSKIQNKKRQTVRDEQKRLSFESLRSEGVAIRIHMQPTPGFEGPQRLQKEYVILDFNRDLSNTRGLRVTDDGISVDLTFDGRWSPIKLPWKSVFGLESMNDARFSVWDEDAPETCML